MKKRALLFAFILCTLSLSAQERPPRLILQIVVSSLRGADLERYASNFSDHGVRMMMQEGTYYTDARYNYQRPTTPVGLATLTTGAMPSTHGIVGTEWMDYTSNTTVELTSGERGKGAYNIYAPTVGDALKRHNDKSIAVSVALDPTSAIVMGGHTKHVYWIEPTRCDWASSSYYTYNLPDWVLRANRDHYSTLHLAAGWRTLYDFSRYKNTRRWDISLSGMRQKESPAKGRLRLTNNHDRLLYTPAGNTAVAAFAKQAIVHHKLGKDKETDILNICFDASRYITEAYGPESVVAEDMLYRLDLDIADLVTFAKAQVEDDAVAVVITSDHGSSPSYNSDSKSPKRFNSHQFSVIVEGFLNVRYGSGDWVVGHGQTSLWLNHNLIYERGLRLAEVENEVASFAMHFEGVSHVLTSTALRNGYFGSGYGEKMQNSFYPRRSGDIAVSLMPEWIEHRDRCWSASGSMYGYDTHVPLIFYGKGISAQRITRSVEMTSVAPTVARIAAIEAPAASEGVALEEITTK